MRIEGKLAGGWNDRSKKGRDDGSKEEGRNDRSKKGRDDGSEEMKEKRGEEPAGAHRADAGGPLPHLMFVPQSLCRPCTLPWLIKQGIP